MDVRLGACLSVGGQGHGQCLFLGEEQQMKVNPKPLPCREVLTVDWRHDDGVSMM